MAKILRGPEPENVVPNKPLGQLLYSALKLRSVADNTCLVELKTGEHIKPSRLLNDSLRLYFHLKRMNLDKNSVIAVFTQTTWKCLLPVFSAAYGCIPLHPINPDSSIGELKHIISQSKPSTVFTFSEQLPNILTLRKELSFIKNVIVIDDSKHAEEYEEKEKGVFLLKKLLESSGKIGEVQVEDASMDEVIMLVNSSGTTGLPKCVMLTHTNARFLFNVWANERIMKPTSEDASVVFHPLYHLYGLFLILTNLIGGAKTIIMDKFHGTEYLKTVKEHNAKMLFLVPSLVQYFAKLRECDENSFRGREIICGASMLKPEIIEIMRQRYGVRIRQLYGMTEASLVMVNFKDEIDPKGVGHVVPGIEVKFVDHETNQLVAANEIGELCVRGDNVMKGYLNDERSTKEAIDSDGYLHSGDLGYYDEDGTIFITDRLKDIIKFKAHQVSPTQIEAVLLQHPAVNDAAVTSVPDEYAGELPCALIVKQQGADVTKEDIIDHVKGHLSYCNHLHGGVKFVDQIPKTRTGKILRNKLNEML